MHANLIPDYALALQQSPELSQESADGRFHQTQRHCLEG